LRIISSGSKFGGTVANSPIAGRENGQLVGMVALGDLAVQNQYANEAEEALQSISTPSAPQQ
jgi:hypothetical protein